MSCVFIGLRTPCLCQYVRLALPYLMFDSPEGPRALSGDLKRGNGTLHHSVASLKTSVPRAPEMVTPSSEFGVSFQSQASLLRQRTVVTSLLF